MIKYISLLFLVFITFMSQAETGATGIIQSISLEENRIEINNISYKIDSERTVLISDMHTLDLEYLEVGELVNFLLDGNIVIQIQLTTSFDEQS